MANGKELSRSKAFENYYAQGLSGERSLKQTASDLHIPLATIREWHEEDHWEDHIDSRNLAVAKRVDEKVVEKVAEVKASYHKMVRDIISKWYQHHLGSEESAQLLVMTADVDQFLKLIKADLVLMGAPDAIKHIEGNVTVGVEERMRELSIEDLKAIISKRKQLIPAVTVEAEKVEPSEPKP